MITGSPRSFDWEKAIELFEDGYTIEGVMKKTGASRAALWNMRRTLDYPIRFKRGPKPIDEEFVAELTRKGWSARRIAERLHCDERTVVRARRRYERDYKRVWEVGV